MSGQQYIVNSTASLMAYQKWCADEFEKHKYLTFPAPRRGKDRSLTQNALFHVFITEIAAFCTGQHPRKISSDLIEGTKLLAKRQCYAETHQEWLLQNVIDPETGETECRPRSSADYKTGEMFFMLEWLQNHWAQKGLVLESKGEFAKKQREQNE